jgi:acyl-CoA thioesterase
VDPRVDQETKQKILAKLRHDPYAELLGMEVLDVKPGYSLVSMVVRDDMFSFHGLPHGGAIFSVADAAFGAAANSHGVTSVALNMEISYLRTVSSGTRLLAEATEEHLGRRTALYHITVATDDGDLVASCHGVVYRKKEPFLTL